MWESFNEYSSYHILINRMSEMVIDVFGDDVIDGLYDEKLMDDSFIDEKLTEKYGDKYESVLIEREKLNICIDPEEFWGEVWGNFEDKISN